jgi:catechol 2,3-dioxygenase-like lactoylglutathione lyase family enzyme
MHVFYRGTDDGIHELFRTADGKWVHNDVTAMAKAPKAAGDPSGYAEEGNKTQHVIYRTGEGGLVEMFSKQGDAAGWRMRDLTMEVKAPKAAGDPNAFYWRGTKSQHVLYRSEDDGIQELFLDPEGHWQHNDLTAITKAPKAAGNPFGYVEEGNKTEHVVFRTEAGAIVELFAKYRETNAWHMDDLSKVANAPKAAGDPTGYSLNESTLRGITTQHVFFRGEDGNVHELYQGGPEKKWAHNDVTAEAKGPKAVTDPATYALEANRTQHVVYRTEDHKVFELYNIPDGPMHGWHANDLSAAAHVPAP